MSKRSSIYHIIYIALAAIVISFSLTSCSTTRAIPDNEQLFAGLKKISYVNYEEGGHADSTIAEMEYVLASAPQRLCLAVAITCLLSLCVCGFGMPSQNQITLLPVG